MRPVALRQLMVLFLISSFGVSAARGLAAESPAADPLTPPATSNSISRGLEAIEREYAPPAYVCGQYFFDMMDLARRAEARVPEVVEIIRVGSPRRGIHSLLRFMDTRVLLLVVPDLLDLTESPDPAVRERAYAALFVVLKTITDGGPWG